MSFPVHPLGSMANKQLATGNGQIPIKQSLIPMTAFPFVPKVCTLPLLFGKRQTASPSLWKQPVMKTFLLVLLIIHIASGFTALVTGGIASMTRKGGGGHRTSGKWYFWAMTGVFITATAIGILKSLAFLFMVGFFSYYFVVRGYRILYLKNLGRMQKPLPLDWAICASAALFGLSLITWSVSQYLHGNSFWPVPLAFGLTSGGFAFADVKFYLRGAKTKQDWLIRHIVSMGAGYIATWTAFVVTNVKFLPPVIVWLLPGVIGGIIITRSVRKYTRPKGVAMLAKTGEGTALPA